MNGIGTTCWILGLAGWLFTACPPCEVRAAFPAAMARANDASTPAPQSKEPEKARAREAEVPSKDDARAEESEAPKDLIVDHRDVTVASGETVGNVLVTFGNARVEGDVTGDLVVVFGTATVTGQVQGDAVALGGVLSLEEGAHVKGDAVGIGGGVLRGANVRIDGKTVNLGWEAIPASWRDRARLFFEECVLLGRPLSLRVDFVWWLWGALLAMETLLALLFPGAVRAVAMTCRTRPMASVLAGLAGIPVFWLVVATVSATVVLAPVVLLLVAVVCIGVALGEAAFLRVLGGALLRVVRPAPFPGALEFAVGALLLTGLFLLPFVGILAWAAIDVWVFGAVILAAVSHRKAAPAAAPGGDGASSVVAFAPPPLETRPSPSVARENGGPVAPPVASVAPTFTDANQQPPTFETMTLPEASPASPAFVRPAVDTSPQATRRWHDADPGPALSPDALGRAEYPGMGRRLGALVIDWVPLMVMAGQMPDRLPWVRIEDPDAAFRVLGGIAYFATMLAWRGTTLGGMVAGLRVVRLDGRPMDRPTATVRALAAVLSVLSLGLGWMWASWDARRQTWHDRIAGTVVIRDETRRSLV